MKGQRKPPNRTALVVLSAIAGVLVLVICVGVIGGIMSGGDDEQPQAEQPVPAYTVAKQTEKGDITVEVDQLVTEDQARAIAEDLRGKQTKDNGYWVSINCSTGGTAKADNRLANARFGIGALGQAKTGLDEGQIEVEVNEGRSCPAK
jgi:hypothetical protein